MKARPRDFLLTLAWQNCSTGKDLYYRVPPCISSITRMTTTTIIPKGRSREIRVLILPPLSLDRTVALFYALGISKEKCHDVIITHLSKTGSTFKNLSQV